MLLAFGNDFSDEDWKHTLGGIHLFIELGGQIVSHAAVVPRMLEVGRSMFHTGYVEGVATHHGTGWISGCDDTGGGSEGGCSGPDRSSPPMLGIEVRLKGPRTDQTQTQLNVGAIGETEIDVLLETVDADEEGRFEEVVQVPDVAPGTYFLTAVAELSAYQPPQLVVGGDG